MQLTLPEQGRWYNGAMEGKGALVREGRGPSADGGSPGEATLGSLQSGRQGGGARFSLTSI